jgi:hypothetical protein
MASLVNSSLDLIRRHKLPKHPRLHSRWGDVAISAPTEGAWSRYDNPLPREKEVYGPGFVPGLDVDDKEVLLLAADDGDDDESDDEPPPTAQETEKELSSGSIASLKARRLTRILLPSSANTASKKLDETEKPVEFEYKPFRPNYAQEVAKKNDRQNDQPRFRYVPASEKYMQNLEKDLKTLPPENVNKPLPHSPRSRSCDPSIGTSVVLTERRQPRSHQPESRAPEKAETATTHATVPRSSALRESRDQSRGRVSQKQPSPSPSSSSQSATLLRSPSAAVKSHRRRTMTLTMVSDSEDLW